MNEKIANNAKILTALMVKICDELSCKLEHTNFHMLDRQSWKGKYQDTFVVWGRMPGGLILNFMSNESFTEVHINQDPHHALSDERDWYVALAEPYSMDQARELVRHCIFRDDLVVTYDKLRKAKVD